MMMSVQKYEGLNIIFMRGIQGHDRCQYGIVRISNFSVIYRSLSMLSTLIYFYLNSMKLCDRVVPSRFLISSKMIVGFSTG